MVAPLSNFLSFWRTKPHPMLSLIRNLKLKREQTYEFEILRALVQILKLSKGWVFLVVNRCVLFLFRWASSALIWHLFRLIYLMFNLFSAHSLFWWNTWASRQFAVIILMTLKTKVRFSSFKRNPKHAEIIVSYFNCHESVTISKTFGNNLNVVFTNQSVYRLKLY